MKSPLARRFLRLLLESRNLSISMARLFCSRCPGWKPDATPACARRTAAFSAKLGNATARQAKFQPPAPFARECLWAGVPKEKRTAFPRKLIYLCNAYCPPATDSARVSFPAPEAQSEWITSDSEGRPLRYGREIQVS